MLIEIRHQTLYRYDRPVSYSVQRLLLTPTEFDSAEGGVMDDRGTGHRAGAELSRTASAISVHLISQTRLHEEVSIVARGKVITEDRAGVLPAILQ